MTRYNIEPNVRFVERITVMRNLVVIAVLMLGGACSEGFQPAALILSNAADASEELDTGGHPDASNDLDALDARTDAADVASTIDANDAIETSDTSDTADTSDASDTDDADVVPPPVPEDRWACDTASCWDTGVDVPYCGRDAVNEDFSSGRYNVHRYEATLYEGSANHVTLTRTGGDWQPAIMVSEADGTTLFDGFVGLTRPGFEVRVIEDGTSGPNAEIELITDADLDVDIFVTGWSVIESDFVEFLSTNSTYRLNVANICEELDDLTAPVDALLGEIGGDSGVIELSVGDDPTWGPPVRIDAFASEHVGFRLDFSPSTVSVDLELLAWSGRDATSLGITTAGPGIRVLAAYDPFRNRTFWVRARGAIDSGSLTITRTPIEAGPRCEQDCARLLQLPIPVNAVAQGFELAPYNRFREQFGRRELLMAIFHAGFRVAEAGYGPFEVQDLSNWDGSRPCCHETHTGGYHVDISLLTASGDAAWYDPAANFGDEPMALMLAGLFEAGPYQTGHPAEIILDSGMHDDVRDGADALLERGELSAEIRALFDAERDLIYHYQGHANHIHVRIDR